MSWSRVGYILITLVRNLISVRGVTAFLSSFGALWLAIEWSINFAPGSADGIRKLWWLFSLCGFALAAWQCRPITSIKCRLNGRDVGIEVRVGNIFRQPGALVIGTNTTFDTRIGDDLISERSLQGQFTRRYFANEAQLDAAFAAQLATLPSTALAGARTGKSADYPVGTTVQLRVKEKSEGRSAYLLAMAKMNEHGNATISEEDFQNAISSLWVYVAERSTKDTLLMSVMGSNFGRMTLTREQIIQEILQSFVAACSQSGFCEKLVIVIRGADVTEHSIDLPALRDYLHHLCKYSPLKRPSPTPVGTAVS